MPMLGYMHGIPRPFLIAGMVAGFIWFWPIGLAALAYLVGSGRLGRGCTPGRWYNSAPDSAQAAGRAGWGWGPGGRFSGWGSNAGASAPTSNNSAFDAYRAETLRRLEEEQKEFVDYLDRLRQARDKAEFDSFMAERRRATPPAETPQA